MDIKNLSDLTKIINLCRKRGVESVKIGTDSIEMTFAENVSRETKRAKSKKQAELAPEDLNQEAPKSLSELEMLLWSAENPALTEGSN